MNSVRQLRQRNNNLVFDSGMELIWFLEDAYEQKDIEKFFSIVSLDFKKGFLKFKTQLEKDFSESKQLNLYMLLLSKDRNLIMDTYSYDICWSKRVKKQRDDYWQREFGKATIVFKRYHIYQRANFLVYDIYGDNPFS
ncbi:MAG: hypothetical protein ISS45_03895 [Candidatus Omnitrophica bacterium]|nr:hypothetical protein [Candidatus Omnitrophota bacterium]